MLTLLVCLALPVASYFCYGCHLDRLAAIDPAAVIPCSKLYDGVDYVLRLRCSDAGRSYSDDY